MLTLESEYRQLNAAGVIDDATALRGIAVESGAIFSVAEELRVSLYGAVAAVTAGLGLLLKANLHRIGPLSLVIVLAVVAVGCYAVPIRTRLRHETRSVVGDYILLLGALIVSADLGYAESQFHWLGSHWSRYLLILCATHAVTAYALESPLVLSLALTSLAAWFGLEGNVVRVLQEGSALPQSGARALICAGVIYVWGEIHRRLSAIVQFQETFEHFAANLGFLGALSLCVGPDTRLIGLVCLIALAGVSIRAGLQSAREIFVIYGVAYGALGFLCLETQLIGNHLLAAVAGLATVMAAVSLMWHLHRRTKSAEP